MQFRINSRGSNISECNENLNKQIMQLYEKAENKDEEVNELMIQYQLLKRDISNKSVKFNEDRERTFEGKNYYYNES